MKKLNILYALLIGLVILASCSSDDDGDNNIITQTFLEKYEGTVWQWTGDDYIEYVRILNNETTPAELWESFSEGDCYDYYLVNINELDLFDDFDELPPTDITVEVTENSEDVFEITITLTDLDIYSIVNFQIVGDILEIESNVYANGELVETSIETYERQNIDVDNLPICD